MAMAGGPWRYDTCTVAYRPKYDTDESISCDADNTMRRYLTTDTCF